MSIPDIFKTKSYFYQKDGTSSSKEEATIKNFQEHLQEQILNCIFMIVVIYIIAFAISGFYIFSSHPGVDHSEAPIVTLFSTLSITVFKILKLFVPLLIPKKI